MGGGAVKSLDMEDKKLTYFQYQKSLNLPIYIRMDTGRFDPHLPALLEEMNFGRLSPEEAEEVPGRVERKVDGRLLTLEEASPIAAKKIDFMGELGKYGEESVVPGYGCRVYRYRSVAMMPYSHQSPLWGLGCFKDFGSQEKVVVSRIVLNRFLSYALAPMGIVGFWGEALEEGIALLPQNRSVGKAVFVDVKSENILSSKGFCRMGSRFKVFRLGSRYLNRDVQMGAEDLLPFLFSHLIYFDYGGPAEPVRRAVQGLSKLVTGVDCAPSNFYSMSNLPL